MTSPGFKKSPFFYVGDKYKLLPAISAHFPQNIETFFEPFLGGGSVFLNVEAKKYVVNDIDKNVINLHKYLHRQSHNANSFFEKVKKITKNYDLSRSFFESVIPQNYKIRWPKTYYAEFNRSGYLKLRRNYNMSDKKEPIQLYLLLIYGFNRMFRFNSKGDFNIPVGNVDFNNNVVNALKNYFLAIKERNVEYQNCGFDRFLSSQKIGKNDFLYIDPPYLITATEYNKLWKDADELDLLNTLDKLNGKGVKFALSNVTNYKGKTNDILINWMKKYNVYNIKSNYINYHDNGKKDLREVLITNYA